MTDMFFECVTLKKIDFKNIKGGKNIVTTTFMFYNCKSLEEIDLSFLKVQSIKIMRGMFANCINLRKVVIPRSVKKIVNSSFDNCDKRKLVLRVYRNSFAEAYAKHYGFYMSYID